MPKTLIVPVDGSQAAERGLAVASQLAQRLATCDVLLLSADVDDGERQRPYLDDLARTAALPVRIECVTGDPAGAIVRAAQAEPDATVCMTTHGRGRIAVPFVGSVATEVLRTLDAPVLLVGPSARDDWWHEPPQMVVCWAGTDSDPILAPSVAWSDAFGLELSLLCVFDPLDVPASVDPHAQFTPALAQLDAMHPHTRAVALHDEVPALAIAGYARDLPATIVALTTRARTGLGRAVLGSVALDVVHHSPCPVLAVAQP
jgi:nucleotide-binding universal stress UspA family protein